MRESNPTGGCACEAVRYELLDTPLIVHCCHCTDCQRETGTAYALNLLIEATSVQLLQGTLTVVETPSHSGLGQAIHRCPVCQVAVWSNYGSGREHVHFVRVGTLDDPSAFAPDIHIYTKSMLRHVCLPDNSVTVPEFYRRSDIWSDCSLQRYRKIQTAITR